MVATHRAVDLCVTFFDTADAHGCGHIERSLGQALADICLTKAQEVAIRTT